MRSHDTRLLIILLCGILPLATPAAAQIVLRTPDNATAPFEDWSRGDSNSSYAHWDVFEGSLDAIAPDAGEINAPGALLAETTDGESGAFASGSGNIYSFSGPTFFEAVLPSLDLGSGFQTHFVAQIVTIGTELDYDSALLSYNDGDQRLAPNQITELSRTSLGAGGQGGGGELVSTLFAWQPLDVSPAELLLQFNAAAAHMSLDQVVVDTYTMPNETTTPGDYDGSGTVDAGDYALWRSQFGTIGPQADGNGDGRVDAADYTVWRDNVSAASLAAAGNVAAIPEPGTGQLVLCIALAGLFCIGCDRYFARRPFGVKES